MVEEANRKKDLRRFGLVHGVTVENNSLKSISVKRNLKRLESCRLGSPLMSDYQKSDETRTGKEKV